MKNFIVLAVVISVLGLGMSVFADDDVVTPTPTPVPPGSVNIQLITGKPQPTPLPWVLGNPSYQISWLQWDILNQRVTPIVFRNNDGTPVDSSRVHFVKGGVIIDGVSGVGTAN